MAARAISSRATSSISFAEIANGQRLPLALVAAQLVLDRVHQRLPRRLDDVVGDAHRAPGLVAVARGDQHARLGRRCPSTRPGCGPCSRAGTSPASSGRSPRGPCAGRGRARSPARCPPPRCARRCPSTRSRTVASATGSPSPRVLLDDHAVAVQVEVRPVIAERPLHQELEARPPRPRTGSPRPPAASASRGCGAPPGCSCRGRSRTRLAFQRMFDCPASSETSTRR